MKKILLFLIILGSNYLVFGQSSRPVFDLDHIIIWTEKGAPELELFKKQGFTPAAFEMVHTGFGTGGKYILFYNIYLEFLYENEPATVDPKLITALPFPRTNWRKTGESPVGFGLTMAPYDTAGIPFRTQEVKAPWMLPNTSLFFATSNHTHKYEPLVLIVHPDTKHAKFNTFDDLKLEIEKKVPANDTARKTDLLKSFTHANGVEKLTSVKVTCKANDFSPTMKALKDIDQLQIVKGKESLLEMTFDGHRQNKTVDFRPKLPMIVRY